MSNKKTLFINPENFRIVFSIIFSSLYLLCSRIYTGSIYYDMKWYINSGDSLISGKASFSNYLYSPLFSIFSKLIYFLSDFYFLLNILFICKLIFIFLIGYLLYDLILISTIKSDSFWNKYTFSSLIFMLFNPYVLKYSDPIYSDSFSLIAGLLFAIRYALLNSNKKKIYRLNSLLSKNSYYSCLLFLTLFRYTNIILLVTSALIDFFIFIKKINKPEIFLLYRLIVIFIYTFLIILFIRNYLDPFAHKNYLSTFLLFLISTLGFREAFFYNFSNPLELFNSTSIHNYFILNDINIPLSTIKFSIFIASIILISNLIGLFRLFYFKHPLSLPLLVGLALLIISEIYIGYAHYRYMIMFIPSICIGLSFRPINIKEPLII